jgi:hypothetical protein
MQIDYMNRIVNPFQSSISKIEIFNKYLKTADGIIISAPGLSHYYAGFGVPTFF